MIIVLLKKLKIVLILMNLVEISSIVKENINKTYCAVIHGKYNDGEVIDEVRELIGSTKIKVKGKSNIPKIKYYSCIFLLGIIFYKLNF